MADDTPIPMRPPRSGIDAATVIGLISGIGLVSVAIYLGGSPGSFINIPAVLIVIGGTLAVTTMCFSFRDMIHTFKVVSQAMVFSRREPGDAAIQVLQIAELARRRGVLSLQPLVDDLRREPFLQMGMGMVVDGTPGEEVESIMRRDLQATILRHHRSASVLRRMAEFSPALGLIGTLIGLVQMLGQLQDPATIGPSMAVALLTTFYGAVLANMVFMPIAAKLEKNSNEESLINTIYMMGASSVGRQENPRRLEMMINSILSPTDRVQHFD